MNKEDIKNAIELYFKTLAEFGRTVSPEINPMEWLIDKESQFSEYLNKDELYCWFCLEPMVVIQIDYKTQRPVWGCRKDKATKGLMKLRWLDHCADCGTKLNLKKEWLEDQAKYMDNPQVKTCCENCIGNGNILDEDDMKNVHKVERVKV